VNNRFLLVFSALLAISVPAWAQVSASISGRVEDPSGAGVGGASITVTSLETGATRTTTSAESGQFQILSLPLGQQELKVEKQGFKSVIRTGLNLEVGQDAVANVQLQVGDVSQRVDVTELTPLVNVTTEPTSGVVGERQVKDLPLNGRSFDTLITLNPGAIEYNLKSANTSTSNGYTFSVSGRRPAENLFLLNGIEYTGSSQLAITPGGVSGQLLGIDAVREFNVLTDTYSAEYGKRSGAQVSVVTQSGTNSLHGSAYEFLRNSALDARNFFDQGNIPPFRRNQFGAALGGPLIKNRLFLFGNYEGFRQALALSNVTVAPDNLVRMGQLPSATTGVYSTPANLNPGILKYMSLWPAINGPELFINASNCPAQSYCPIPSGTALSYNHPRSNVREDFGTMRMDYTIGNRDNLSGAYTIDDGDSLIPQADPLFASSSLLRNQVASIQETHIISPQMLNTFRFGFSRAAYGLLPVSLQPFDPSLSFVTGQGPGGIVVGGGTSTTAAAAITSAGPNNAANVYNRRNLFTYSDDLKMTWGRHQITYGFWMQRVQDNENGASRTVGVATFASLATFLSATTTTFQVVPDANLLGWRSLFGALYLTDTIRLRSNLTLNLGIRDEFTTGWNEKSGRAANYITDSNGILETNPIVGTSAFTQNHALKLLSPRVGLAWDVSGNGKTSIRAGFGQYYSLIDDLSFLLNSLPPANTSISCPGAFLTLLPVTSNWVYPSTCSVAPQGVQADARTPTVVEWNFRVEHELSRDTVLRVSYVGSHGYHGFVSIDPNSIPAQTCASATCIAGGTPGTTTSTVPMGAQYIPVTTRPNPKLGAGFFWYTEGNSSYNALQIDVVRRLSHGLQVRGNFTFSKNLDMNSALTGAQASNQAQMVMDRNDLPRDWGPSALNVADQGSISATYQLPFGKGSRGLTEQLIGGWQLNGIATFLSGFPFTPQVGSNRSGDGDTRNPDRPSLNPAFTGPVVTGNPNQWFNPAAFLLPAAGTWGTLGRGTYTGPGLAEVDLSLFKAFKITERTDLQFRAECFNIANRPNFGTPNAIVFSNGAVSPSAGLITTTVTSSRQIQFGLKLMF
jgi:Carboxypeptidase regulatory-like domain/TonB-dependent Receptor Plug Domain